jgi:hypothetical protein
MTGVLLSRGKFGPSHTYRKMPRENRHTEHSLMTEAEIPATS